MTLAAALLALWPWLAGVPVEPLRAVEIAAADYGVPLDVLAAVCWQESRLSLAPRYASLCGVRVGHRYVRDDGQSATIAARTLARAHARCGTWLRAVAAYRADGHCGAAAGLPYAARVVALAGRLRRAMRGS